MKSVNKLVRAGLAAVIGCFATSGFAQTAPLVHADHACPAAPVPAGFHSRFAQVNGVTIHYVIGGHGPAMLLIHGWPETWYSWHQMMPRLARDHTVIAVDYRGAGQSSVPAGGYDRKTMAQDLYQLMLKLGDGHVTLVAHDWGVPIAYAYAATHRGSVDRIVAIDGAVFGPWTKDKDPFWFFGFQAIPGFAERVLAGHYAEYLDWFYRNQAMHVVPMAPSEIALYECSYARPGHMRAGFELYRTIDQDIADNRELSRTPLAIPVLAIGAERGLGPGVAASMAHVASHVTPVVMHDTGHFIPDERPRALIRMIENFIAGKPIPASWQPSRKAS